MCGVAAARAGCLRSLACPTHPSAASVVLRRRTRTARCRCTTLQLAGTRPRTLLCCRFRWHSRILPPAATIRSPTSACPPLPACPRSFADICAMLLDAAPHVLDRGDSEGDTPLHNVCRGACGCRQRMRAALGCLHCSLHGRCRCLPSCPAHVRRPPALPLLAQAARGSHAAVVRLLLDRGADCTLQNDEFKTATQLAERGSEGCTLLEEAARRAAAAAAEAEPQQAPPAAEVA